MANPFLPHPTHLSFPLRKMLDILNVTELICQIFPNVGGEMRTCHDINLKTRNLEFNNNLERNFLEDVACD